MKSLLDLPWLAVRARRIYLASSWRNEHQPALVAALRGAGHEVYDFRNPAPGEHGFGWRQTGEDVQTIDGYMRALKHPVAGRGYLFDKRALDWCDTCVLALPSGRSAHLEAGYCVGQGKHVVWWLHPDKWEPELMYLLGHDFVVADV